MHFRILLFLISASLTVSAQHNHYIYIQSDNAQSFYIRKGADITSSSSSGFVILPRILPGQQEFVVGFPKNAFPEYQFVIEIKGKDRGFALKNFNEKGWGLFDLQSLEVIMGKKVEVKKEVEKADTGPLTDDPFSVILASAVGDQRIRQTSLVYHEEIITQNNLPSRPETTNNKPTGVPIVVAKTTVPVKKEPTVTSAPATNSQATASSATNTQVTNPQEIIPAAPNTKGPISAESVTRSNVDPSKKVETTRDSVVSVKTDSTVAIKPQGVKNETAATGTALPSKKEKQSAQNSEPLQSDPTRIKTESVNETATAKKSGLFKKNPFARKTTEPVKAAPGVVMIAGGTDKEKTGEKKGNETISESFNAADSATGVTSNDSALSKESPAALNAHVVKYAEFKKNGETMLVYIDRQSNRDDTILISIAEEPAVETEKITAKDTLSKTGPGLAVVPVPVVKEKPAPTDAENSPGKERETKPAAGEPTVDTKIPAAIVKDSSLLEKKEPAQAVSKTADTRTDCRKMASEKDMVAMRKKMIMMADEDEMIALALKDFKSRCYSADRIQNLSYVFTSDKGRYKLFDAAYPYVYDPSNFAQLERLLNEDYYIKRFRALVNKN